MGCARGRDDGGRDVRHRDDRRCSVAEPAAIEQRVRAAVREACIRHAMVQPEDTVLVALSGGQDSLCLLHVLCGLRAEMQTRLLAGHLHHGMRGAQADRDVRVLEGLCAEWRVPFHWERVPVGEMAAERAVSVEEAGREARYDFLQRLATEHGAERIATGHTATDRAETVLMHILRGSGLDGLRGIPLVDHVRLQVLGGHTACGEHTMALQGDAEHHHGARPHPAALFQHHGTAQGGVIDLLVVVAALDDHGAHHQRHHRIGWNAEGQQGYE